MLMPAKVGNDPYMLTYTGKVIWPKHIEDLVVDIEDISHALSMVNRYAGHLNWPYSVAQHSVLVEHIVTQVYGCDNEKTQLTALLHDASEAYLPDLPYAWKAILPEFKALELKLEERIFDHFGLTLPMPKLIKEVDVDIRGSEMACLSSWSSTMTNTTNFFNLDITPWTQDYAKTKFLERFYEING